MNKYLRLLIAFTWELPQTIIALFVLLFLKKFSTKVDIIWNVKYFVVIHNYKYFGCGLGPFAMLSSRYPNWDTTIKHEGGHTQQSLILGWLYLPVVALPSVTQWWLTKIKVISYYHYYFRFPENWADYLAGITRKK